MFLVHISITLDHYNSNFPISSFDYTGETPDIVLIFSKTEMQRSSMQHLMKQVYFKDEKKKNNCNYTSPSFCLCSFSNRKIKTFYWLQLCIYILQNKIISEGKPKHSYAIRFLLDTSCLVFCLFGFFLQNISEFSLLTKIFIFVRSRYIV